MKEKTKRGSCVIKLMSYSYAMFIFYYRKPLVTRKVLSDDEKTNDEDSVLTNGDVKDTEDKDDIPEDLPEGMTSIYCLSVTFVKSKALVKKYQ
jgi:hypothetical protein